MLPDWVCSGVHQEQFMTTLNFLNLLYTAPHPFQSSIHLKPILSFITSSFLSYTYQHSHLTNHFHLKSIFKVDKLIRCIGKLLQIFGETIGKQYFFSYRISRRLFLQKFRSLLPHSHYRWSVLLMVFRNAVFHFVLVEKT